MDEVLTLAFAMRLYRMLDVETTDHPALCPCRSCARRKMWATEALQRAKRDSVEADVRPELTRDL